MRNRTLIVWFVFACFFSGMCLKAQSTNPVTFAGPHTTGLPNTQVYGDLNGDGKTDILNPSISYLGDGKGGFTALPANGNVPAYEGFVAADVNGDGKSDLLLALGGGEDCENPPTEQQGEFYVELSDGKGGWQLSQSFQLGFGNVLQMLTADFNRDGKPDVAILQDEDDNCGNDYQTLSIILNHGDGTFTGGSSYTLGPESTASFAIGDFSGDGIDDLLLFNGENVFNEWIGDGKGSFAMVSTYTIAGRVFAYALGDTNHDGRGDIVVSLSNGNNNVLVTLLSKESGNGFYWLSSSSLPGITRSIQLRDFNGDGKLDVVANVAGAIYSYAKEGSATNGNFGSPTKSLGLFDVNAPLISETLVTGGPLDLFVSDKSTSLLDIMINTSK